MLSSFRRHLIALVFIPMGAHAYEQSYQEAPEVFYEQGYQVSVLDHCIEAGHVRPVRPLRRVCLETNRGERVSYMNCREQYRREYFLSRPIVEVQSILLPGQRVFTKINRTKVRGHKIEVYERERLKETYYYDIPECTESLITNRAPLIYEQQANAKEALVYGALYQKGITLIDGESWTLEQVARGKGYAPDRSKDLKSSSRSASLWYTSPNCKRGQIIPVEIDQYLESLGGELTGSGRVQDGGELTGSGRELDSGSLMVRLNVDQMTFQDLKYKSSGPFGIRGHLERFINGEREIPRSLVNISCLRR